MNCDQPPVKLRRVFFQLGQLVSNLDQVVAHLALELFDLRPLLLGLLRGVYRRLVVENDLLHAPVDLGHALVDRMEAPFVVREIAAIDFPLQSRNAPVDERLGRLLIEDCRIDLSLLGPEGYFARLIRRRAAAT